MELKKASWDVVPQILAILKTDWPERKTSCYTLRGIAELRKKFKDLRKVYNLLTPGGVVDKYATFVVLSQNHEHLLEIYLETMNPDLKPLTTCIANCKELDFSKKVLYDSVHSRFFPIIHDLAEQFNLDIQSDPTQSYHMNRKQAKAVTYKLPEDVYLGKVKPEHASLVNELWPHGIGEASLPKVKQFIRNRWSVGIYNKKTKNLIAWCLLMEYGGPGLLQVVEEQKRKGYGELALRIMTKHCGDHGLEPMAFIDLGNIPSAALFQKLGYEPGYYTSWFYTTPKSTS